MIGAMISIRKGGLALSHKTWLYPAGETGVRIDWENYRFRDTSGDITIRARLQTHADFMELVMAVSALEEWDKAPRRLILYYVPNGRQDRVCARGDSFGLLAFARQIAALGFKELVTFDPHSDVTVATFRALGLKVTAIDQGTIIGRFDALNARLQPVDLNAADRPLFCSPDAGANKKVAALAGLYSHDLFIRADKLRDMATGKIKEIVVVNPREEVEGRDIVIVDDVLDKGGTFLGLAKALRAKGARAVELFVTHGLFTADLDTLIPSFYEAGISRIWTTSSYRTDLAGRQNMLTVLDLDATFPNL